MQLGWAGRPRLAIFQSKLALGFAAREQTSAAAQHDRNQGERQVVDETCLEELADDFTAIDVDTPTASADKPGVE